MPSNAANLVLGLTQSTAAHMEQRGSSNSFSQKPQLRGMVSRSKHRKSDGRVKINVGGKIFETTVSTLTRLENTVLDYLRDGENFAFPKDRDARESLRRKAEFYNLPGLAELCSGLHKDDRVMWEDSYVEANWKYFARYEYNGRKSCMDDNCVHCGGKTHILATQSFTINYEEWKHVKHRMQFMKGIVTKVKSKMCCAVKWDNGWYLHHPQSHLRLATSE